MPRVTDAHRKRRRRQILDAVVACFDRNALHSTSTDDIAAEAQLSAGAMYRYFDGKEAIIELSPPSAAFASAPCWPVPPPPATFAPRSGRSSTATWTGPPIRRSSAGGASMSTSGPRHYTTRV